MTKEDREDEIADQHNYLDAVAMDAGVNLSNPYQRIVLFGFSQGTATAVRWLLNSRFNVDALVLWAGSFPPDVLPSKIVPQVKEKGFHYVYGTQDDFLKDLNMKERLAPLTEQGLTPTVWTFDGPHTMNADTLSKLEAEINRD